MVFQSAMNSLNPVMKIGDQIADAIQAHEQLSDKARDERVNELLTDRRHRSEPHRRLPARAFRRDAAARRHRHGPCAQSAAADHGRAHDRARCGRAAGDHAAARRSQEQFGFSVLFITHDLSLLVEFSDRIGIMYAGEIVEEAPRQGAVQGPEASLYLGADAFLPAGAWTAAGADRYPGRAAEPAGSTGRLPVPRPAARWVRALPAAAAAADPAPG